MSEMGFFAVDRGLFDDPDFDPEPFTQREAWLWLIKEAAWKKRQRRIAGQIIELERSQLTASIRFMAKAWQWSKSRVARFIERIAACGMILKKTAGGCQQLVITICNYNRFQRVSRPRKEDGTVAGQQRDTSSDCNCDTFCEGQNVTSETAGQQRDKQEYIKKHNNNHPPIVPREPERELRNQEAASPDEEEEIIDLEFEKFWRAFPSGRKHDKLKARRKYRAIVSGRDPDLKATTGELLAGATLYASKMVGREARFTKMPCTWLTNGCWLEDNAGAPPVFGLQEKPKPKPKSPNEIWFDNLARKTYGSEQYDAMLAGGSR